MKLLIFLIASATLAHAAKPVAFDWASRSSPGFSTCATGPNCLTGFTLTDSFNGLTTIVGVYPQDSVGAQLTAMPAVGTHVFQLGQNYTDGAGLAHTTNGNPGIVVNCYRNADKNGRYCTYGKVWVGE